MRNSLKLSLVAVLVVGVVGCSNKEDRQKSMIKSINSFSQYGFDINKTGADSSKYILTVKDNKRLTQNLLALFNQQTLMPNERKPIEELVKDAKIGVEVDWDKYSQNKEDSVFVYYLGNGKESAEFKKFLEGKNLGAYLTFNKDNDLTVAKSKSIDTIFNEGNKKVHIMHKDAILRVDKFAHTFKEPRKYVVDFGKLNINDDSTSFALSNYVCSVDMQSAYIGSSECKFENFTFTDKRLDAKYDMKNIIYKALIKESGGKLNSDVSILVDSINFSTKEMPNSNSKVTMVLDKLAVDLKSSNIDKNLVDNMYSLMEKNVTTEVMAKELFEILPKYMASGIKGSGVISYDKFRVKGANEQLVSLSGYKSNFSMLLDKVINFSWSSNTKDMKIVSVKRGKRVELSTTNDKFGYKIENMYNFMPDFISAIPKDGKGNIDEAKMKEIGQNIINRGFGFKLGTVGFDAAKVDATPMKFEFGKLTIDLNSKLKENKVDVTSRVSQMQLMQYLEADGKVVLKRKDLDTILRFMPPTTAMMVSAFVKSSGDDAVFELEFKDGHLTINGKQLM